ncbi:MAG: nucleotidyltransferase substrate binding protein [Elusimicrobia bacterium]|nr:nucleotidyltransferase substrate binding protein [Elusimicrobiota bacterium]
MLLDLSSLKKAVSSLERAIIRSRSAPLDEELRDAVIQRFEYTFELSWKMLKRRLEIEMANPSEADRLAFEDLLREAAQRGLIADVEQWMDYREQRNITSHTYDEQKAGNVYREALQFHADAQSLLGELEKRNRP